MEYLKILGCVFGVVTAVFLAVLLGVCFITLSWTPFDVTLWNAELRAGIVFVYVVMWVLTTAIYLDA